MAAPKKAKVDAVVSKNYPIVTSDVCKVCTCQCALGISYMKKVNSGFWGKGVVCKKDV